MTDTHAARPLDLVALVTFDGEVRENLAMTRDRLPHPDEPPHALGAALEQWLGLGRRTWITVHGRQVRGIATARELSARTAWEIDTLIDAEVDGLDDEPAVIGDLLRQAIAAAEEAEATHLLLRTPLDGPAVADAMRAGFQRVCDERVWRGRLDGSAGAAAGDSNGGNEGIELREPADRDEFPLFQLYSRAVPGEARQALAMTLDEWRAVRDRRWHGRGGRELVAVARDRIVGQVRVGRHDGVAQFALTVEPGDAARGAGEALLAAAAPVTSGDPTLTLVPRHAAAVEALLLERHFEPGEDYVLLSRRLLRPIREAAPVRAGIAIRTSG